MGRRNRARRGGLAAPTFEALEPRSLLASAPIVITRGGTYSGSWENLNDVTPVITVKTTEPVVIQNSTVRGKGPLIYSGTAGSKITIKNTSGYSMNPNVFGEATGRFALVKNPDSLTVQDNYLEGTAGIYVLGYDGDHTSAQTIKVIGNRAKNIDGRMSNGAGGYLDFNLRKHTSNGKLERGYEIVQFLQLDKVANVPGIEIAWNEIVNEVGKSRVEDNISIYNSSGTASSPIKIHDNYVEGAYTLRPWQTNYTNGNWAYDWGFAGGGIMVGDGNPLSTGSDTAFVKAFGNTVVATTNHGLATAAGHDTDIYANRVVSCGKLPDGRTNLEQNVGVFVWDSYKAGATRFFKNTAHDNTVGWVLSDGSRNDWWSPHAGVFEDMTHWSGTVTRQTELNEAAAWQARRHPTGIIAGTIFKDVDGDGVRDSTEGGISGFTAYLDLDNDNIKDSSEPTSKSSSTGRYQFSSLAPGKYVVRALANSGWRISTSASATLTAAQATTITRNFGVSQTTLVSGTVFMDADRDGAFDSIEDGLGGWRVFADKDGDGVFDSGEPGALTDANGNFKFVGLVTGTHKVRVVGLSGYTRTTPSSGYRSVTLSSGQVIANQLFGFKRL